MATKKAKKESAAEKIVKQVWNDLLGRDPTRDELKRYSVVLDDEGDHMNESILRYTVQTMSEYNPPKEPASGKSDKSGE